MACKKNLCLPKNILENLYLKEKKTMKEIGVIFNVSYVTIRHYIHKYKIKSRGKEWNKKDIKNLKFGNLLVIEESSKKNKNRNQATYWICKCSCGNIRHYSGYSLRKNKVKSCGCLKSVNNWKGFQEISGTFWTRIKRESSYRGFDFLINKEYAWELFLKQNKKCALSGIPLKFAKNYYDNRVEQNASLDRIDSSLGYIENNIQWLDKRINIMKSNMSSNEFIEFCRNVVNFNENKECPRKTGLKNGLRQLTVPQLQKVVNYDKEMIFDNCNYSDGKFCALAVGAGLDTMENPSQDKVYQELVDLGYSIYNTRGIKGDFYTTDRKNDLILAAQEVIEEKLTS